MAGFLILSSTPNAGADDPKSVTVRTLAEFRSATAAARPGSRIRVAPGTYDGGSHLSELKGEKDRPIVIEALDPKSPPLFRGGANGLQLTDPSWVELRHLSFSGQTGNGLNIDDGGTMETPAHDLVLDGIIVSDVGPDGNRDGIKLSGLVDFRVRDTTVERWGRGGSAIDMVGCLRGTIETCTFRHAKEASDASGVQAKGGSREVTIRRCRFEHAGGRAVNVGGSTGLAYFRPPLAAWRGARFESKDIVVEGCTIVGSTTPVAFVGCDGATFRFNLVYCPGRWGLRILQETKEDGFVPCRGGVVSDNLFVFRSDSWASGGANVGPGTDAASFRFERNAWYCLDAPARTKSLVSLPVAEVGGVHGKDPGLVDADERDPRQRPGGPSGKVGPLALPK